MARGLVRLRDQTINEFGEQLLELELAQRARSRVDGKCDYCGREPTAPACKYPRRHHDHRISTPKQLGLQGSPDPNPDAATAISSGRRFDKFHAMQMFLVQFTGMTRAQIDAEAVELSMRAAAILRGDF
jgi:hypothetical protein